MTVDDLPLLGGGDVGPGPAVGCGAFAGLELGDQVGDRPGGADRFAVGTGLARGRVEPRVEDLAEDPLRPAVVLRVGGGDRAAWIVRQTQPTQLTPVGGDVLVGGDGRVLAGLDRVLLGGQAERVEPHRVQHVVAGHALEPGVHVGADEPQRVADVQAGAGRIGEHVEHEQLLAAGGRQVGVADRAGRVGRLEGVVVVPPVLPPQLDVLRQARRIAEGWDVLGGVGGRCVSAHTGGPAYGGRRSAALIPDDARRVGLGAHPGAGRNVLVLDLGVRVRVHGAPGGSRTRTAETVVLVPLPLGYRRRDVAVLGVGFEPTLTRA